MKKYIVEFIGTAVLTLAIIGSITTGAGFMSPVIAGLTLAIIVATMGSISGAHVNPAITLGLLSIRKIEWKEAIFYILAQFAGGALALIITRLHAVALPAITSDFSWIFLCAEFIGTLIFAFGIASIALANDQVAAASKAPFVIGGSLAVGVMLAISLGSNAILNPALAFGIGSLGIAYVIGPVVGAVAGMWLYKALKA